MSRRAAAVFGIHTDIREFYPVYKVCERRFGIMVDRLHAQEEVVIKSLGALLGEITGVAGATITGEGKVVLILDMAELVQAMHPVGVRLNAR